MPAPRRCWLDRASERICEALKVNWVGFPRGTRPTVQVGRGISANARRVQRRRQSRHRHLTAGGSCSRRVAMGSERDEPDSQLFCPVRIAGYRRRHETMVLRLGACPYASTPPPSDPPQTAPCSTTPEATAPVAGAEPECATILASKKTRNSPRARVSKK